MNGPIPADLMGRHSCDNPPCVNPAHILPGSAADNSRDAVERDRHVRGERSPQARLTAAQVVEIRERYAAGELTASIGGRFGIRHNHVCDIAHGVLWASAGGPITRGNERAPTEEVSR